MTTGERPGRVTHIVEPEWEGGRVGELRGREARRRPLEPAPRPYEIAFVPNDGGRAATGRKGDAGDCVTRAIAIATATPYGEVYDALAEGMAKRRGKHRPTASAPRATACSASIYQPYLESLGWEWVPTMQIGSGCRVHLRADELPDGPIIVRLSRHVAAVINGVLFDTHDCSREGTRAVYGYFRPRAS